MNRFSLCMHFKSWVQILTLPSVVLKLCKTALEFVIFIHIVLKVCVQVPKMQHFLFNYIFLNIYIFNMEN